jgi:hypothetical protein
VISNDAASFSFSTWRPATPPTKGLHVLTANYPGSTNFTAVSASCKFVVQ